MLTDFFEVVELNVWQVVTNKSAKYPFKWTMNGANVWFAKKSILNSRKKVYWIQVKTRQLFIFLKNVTKSSNWKKNRLISTQTFVAHLKLGKSYIFGTMEIIRCLSIEKHFSWPNLIWFWSHFELTTLSTKCTWLKNALSKSRLCIFIILVDNMLWLSYVFSTFNTLSFIAYNCLFRIR